MQLICHYIKEMLFIGLPNGIYDDQGQEQDDPSEAKQEEDLY